MARFSFLMVLLPIIGAALLDILSISSSTGEVKLPAAGSLVIGFLAAYVSGFLACSWMIQSCEKRKPVLVRTLLCRCWNRFNCVCLISWITANPKHTLKEQSCSLINHLTWTSFDVVNKIRKSLRYHLGIQKIKVGHAGTLDPLATGLVIICTGKATKQIIQYQDLDKAYDAHIRLGPQLPLSIWKLKLIKPFHGNISPGILLIRPLEIYR